MHHVVGPRGGINHDICNCVVVLECIEIIVDHLVVRATEVVGRTCMAMAPPRPEHQAEQTSKGGSEQYLFLEHVLFASLCTFCFPSLERNKGFYSLFVFLTICII